MNFLREITYLLTVFLSLVISCVLAYNLLWKQPENNDLWNRLDRIEKKIDKEKEKEDEDKPESLWIKAQLDNLR